MEAAAWSLVWEAEVDNGRGEEHVDGRLGSADGRSWRPPSARCWRRAGGSAPQAVVLPDTPMTFGAFTATFGRDGSFRALRPGLAGAQGHLEGRRRRARTDGADQGSRVRWRGRLRLPSRGDAADADAAVGRMPDPQADSRRQQVGAGRDRHHPSPAPHRPDPGRDARSGCRLPRRRRAAGRRFAAFWRRAWPTARTCLTDGTWPPARTSCGASRCRGSRIRARSSGATGCSSRRRSAAIRRRGFARGSTGTATRPPTGRATASW